MIEILVAAIAAIAAVGTFFWNQRKDTFVFMEQSFSDLQSINEKILESDKNIDSAIKSVCPEDEIGTEDAREIFIQYMRINRIFRAWQYEQEKFVSEKDAMFIINAHAGVLKNHEDMLDKMLQRGYPKEFGVFLKETVKTAKHPEAFQPRSSS